MESEFRVSDRPTLLLIDDEPALADFLARAAEISGFETSVTGEDQAFRDSLRAEMPAMVALDLGMPGMDGIELLRFLADNDFDGPVLIVSGFDRRILESAMRLGCALGLRMMGPIEKPARLEQLEEIFKQAKNGLAR